jgi:putative protease
MVKKKSKLKKGTSSPATKTKTKNKAKKSSKARALPKKKVVKRAPVAAPVAKVKPTAKASVAPTPNLPWRRPLPGEKLVGVVDDYFSHVGVVVLKLKVPLQVGDFIHVRGHTTDTTQAVASLQIDHLAVDKANVGDEVGIKLEEAGRTGDYIYRTEG